MQDVCIVRSGVVETVHRLKAGVRTPTGALAIGAAHNKVHPGMLFDLASYTFHAPPAAMQRLPASAVQSALSGVPLAPPVAAPVPAFPVAGTSGNGNGNTVTINVNSPPAPVAPAPQFLHGPQGFASAPVIGPPVSSHGDPGGSPAAVSGWPQGLNSPPAAPPSGDHAPMLRARAALRAMQTELWPMEREQLADIAGLFLAHGVAAPDLERIAAAHGMELAAVAATVIEARRWSQERIARIGRLLDANLGAVADESAAAALIAAAQAIIDEETTP